MFCMEPAEIGVDAPKGGVDGDVRQAPVLEFNDAVENGLFGVQRTVETLEALANPDDGLGSDPF